MAAGLTLLTRQESATVEGVKDEMGVPPLRQTVYRCIESIVDIEFLEKNQAAYPFLQFATIPTPVCDCPQR